MWWAKQFRDLLTVVICLCLIWTLKYWCYCYEILEAGAGLYVNFGKSLNWIRPSSDTDLLESVFSWQSKAFLESEWVSQPKWTPSNKLRFGPSVRLKQYFWKLSWWFQYSEKDLRNTGLGDSNKVVPAGEIRLSGKSNYMYSSESAQSSSCLADLKRGAFLILRTRIRHDIAVA